MCITCLDLCRVVCMAAKTTVTITCDVCKQELGNNEQYVNAGTYGVEVCLPCAEGMNMKQVIKLLGLDDIKVMTALEWESAVKYIRVED